MKKLDSNKRYGAVELAREDTPPSSHTPFSEKSEDDSPLDYSIVESSLKQHQSLVV